MPQDIYLHEHTKIPQDDTHGREAACVSSFYEAPSSLFLLNFHFIDSCEICGKGFPQAYKLRNHRITHDRRSGVVNSNMEDLYPIYTAAKAGLEL